MIVLIDNYDSFTYNLYQYFLMLGVQVEVFRNDDTSILDLPSKCKAICISPGPGNPNDSGISLDLIRKYEDKLPILGICLGHQCLAHVYGGNIVQASQIMHGKVSTIKHDNKTVFQGLEDNLEVMRYHSLCVEKSSLPDVFEVSAFTQDTNTVMAIRHKKLPLEGIQFHPESIATKQGLDLLYNFLNFYQVK